MVADLEALIDRPADPDEGDVFEPRPERDPDEAREDDLEREWEEQREAAYAHSHRRRIVACIDHTGGRFHGF